jgi:hypothetical protein
MQTHYTVFLYSILGRASSFHRTKTMNRKRVRVLMATVCITTAFSACVQTGGEMSKADATRAMTSGKAASPSDSSLSMAVRQALDKAPGFNVSGVFVRARRRSDLERYGAQRRSDPASGANRPNCAGCACRGEQTHAVARRQRLTLRFAADTRWRCAHKSCGLRYSATSFGTRRSAACRYSVLR